MDTNLLKNMAQQFVDDIIQDAKRYRRLQILGAAPGGSQQLENGTVLCFSNLDKFVDEDIKIYPTRGEAKLL